jgi:hypothetical protein
MTRPVSLVEELALLGSAQRLTPQVRSVVPGAGPTVGTAFLRDPIELVDRSGVGLRSGYMQGNFEAARREAPDLTVGEFLAGGGADSLFRGVVDSMLGHASATMLRTGDPARYVAALRDAYHDFRTIPTPFDGGVAYSPYRYQIGHHVALPEGRAPVHRHRHGLPRLGPGHPAGRA